MSKSTVTTVTAAEARAFLREPKRFAALSAEAQATVAEGAKGRLHPEAVALHNRRRRTRQYVTGATKDASAAAKALRAEAEAVAKRNGLTVGKRGPIPTAVKEVMAQSKD